jgi:hypothetical protein
MKLNAKFVRYSIAAIVLGTIATQLPAMDNVALADGECFAEGCNNFRLSPSNGCSVPAENTVTLARNAVTTWTWCMNGTTPAPIMKATGPLAFAKGSAANKMRFKCTGAGIATVAARAASNRNCFVSVDINCL